MSPASFSEWMAFYAIDPWGDQRADMRIAKLQALYVNSHLPRGKEPVKLIDFMLYAEKPAPLNEQQSQSVIRNALRGAAPRAPKKRQK